MSTVSDVAQRFRNSDLQSKLSENQAIFMVLPGLFMWSAFMLIPMGYVFLLSMTTAQPSNLFSGGNRLLGLVPIGEAEFVYFRNYFELLFSDAALNGGVFDLLMSNPIALFNGTFWNSFLVTWLFVILSVAMKVAIGIGISLVMTGDRVRGKRMMRGIIIMPMGIPPIFAITVWRSVFSPARFGLANQLLSALGLGTVSWLNQRWPAFFGYLVTEMWLAYPFMVLITVSALQNVNGDLLDAAEVDGAGFFSRLRHVILPAIKRPVMFGTILTAAASFQQFLIPWVFNEGGPNNSAGDGVNEILMVYAYKEAFRENLYGVGGAISLTAVFFMGIFMFIAVKKGKLAEEANE
jgi:arabinogalactan oligomer/maltooligosaccharide transport system permease protein